MSKAAAIATPQLGGSRLILFAAIFYFASGFPYGLVNELLPIYLRQIGLERGEIGLLLSTAGLAWTFKFLWAPFVDRFGTYRSWVSGALLVIAGSLAVLAFSPSLPVAVIWLVLAILATASATQDIAFDGLAIVITPRENLGRINATRVAAYRIAMIVAGGGLAALVTPLGWRGAFGIAIALTIAALVACHIIGARTAAAAAAQEQRSLVDTLLAWLRRPHIVRALIIVILYKVGDAMIIPMIKLLWVDSGYTTREIGLATTVIGVGCTILGAIVGGAAIEKIGIFRGLLALGILQAASNASYAIASGLGAPRAAMYAASVVENFTSGLGTAAFLTLLMALCDRRFAAAEYAMYSAVYGFARSFAGSFSGYVVDDIGYTTFFWISLALSVPGLVAVAASRSFITKLEADPSALPIDA